MKPNYHEVVAFPYFKNNIGFEKLRRLNQFQVHLFNESRIVISQDTKNCNRLNVQLVFRDEVEEFIRKRNEKIKPPIVYKMNSDLDLRNLDKQGSFVENLEWDENALTFKVAGKKKLVPGRVGGSTTLRLNYFLELSLNGAKDLVVDTYSKYKWKRGFLDSTTEEEESRCTLERVR